MEVSDLRVGRTYVLWPGRLPADICIITRMEWDQVERRWIIWGRSLGGEVGPTRPVFFTRETTEDEAEAFMRQLAVATMID